MVGHVAAIHRAGRSVIGGVVIVHKPGHILIEVSSRVAPLDLYVLAEVEGKGPALDLVGIQPRRGEGVADGEVLEIVIAPVQRIHRQQGKVLKLC